MTDHRLELIAAGLLAISVIHTFMSGAIRRWGNRYREGSIAENFFHLFGEVEIVFGLWAAVLLLCVAVLLGSGEAIRYAETRNFTEPLFVLAIMTTASTRPVIAIAAMLIDAVSRALPLAKSLRGYVACLVVGPLLGSFITEPAAMTLTALILRDRYFQGTSSRFMHLTLAVLFVNVSIGGALTSYAAPPVLMVASKWGWDTPFMLQAFGWKVILAVCINALGAAFYLRRELSKSRAGAGVILGRTPLWLILIHLLFLGLIVGTAHHPVIFVGFFLFFLGVYEITREYQDELQIKPALLVAFFLGGIVLLGGMQTWWLQPILLKMDSLALFVGATGLTSITDNAALTYLGAQVEGVSESFKYALVAGALAGGGLTVIANAPNPAGYAILQSSFGPEGIHPLNLLASAIAPTLVAMGCLWFL
jgi:hypothetical protein